MVNQVKSIPLNVLRMFAVWTGLLAWQWGSNQLGCIGSALMIIPFWIILTAALAENSIVRRHTFIAQYLNSQGVLARLLRGKVILLLRQAVKAMIFAILLMINAVFFEVNQWLVLLADIVLLTLIVRFMSHLLSNEVKSDYQIFLAHYWAHWVNTFILWLTLVFMLFYSSHENYTGMSWEQVVHYSASKIDIRCDSLAILARINAVSEALMWWAAQNFLHTLVKPTQTAIAWLALSTWFGMSFLVAWTYSRILTGTLSRSWSLITLYRTQQTTAKPS